jgi:hypothetical protein
MELADALDRNPNIAAVDDSIHYEWQDTMEQQLEMDKSTLEDNESDERNERASCNEDVRSLPMTTVPVTETKGMRPIRIATWNVNQGYDHRRAIDLLIKGHISLITIQEPTKNADSERNWAKTTVRDLRNVGFNAEVTKHNIGCNLPSRHARSLHARDNC